MNGETFLPTNHLPPRRTPEHSRGGSGEVASRGTPLAAVKTFTR
jgi:hypothetical protein